jgi:radical SAM superfamily enzyme YgiQ (UPF0313 family)
MQPGFWCWGAVVRQAVRPERIVFQPPLLDQHLVVGVESGSDRTKKVAFKRPMTNAQVLRAAKIINRHPRVIPYYFLISGNPYEKEQDLIETIRFLGELPAPHFLRTYNLVFFPNTLIYEMAVPDEIISGERVCGYQLDYLAGLNTMGTEWKNRNLYLNSILYLMAGKITAAGWASSRARY